jgi:hypothetical protein
MLHMHSLQWIWYGVLPRWWVVTDEGMDNARMERQTYKEWHLLDTKGP